MGVTLRKRKIAHGRSTLYLDIYYGQGNRKTVPLEIYLEPGQTDENRRKQKLAKSIERKAQEDFENELHDFIPPKRRKEDFMAFFSSLAAKKRGTTKVGYESARKQVEAFIGSKTMPFTLLTNEWVKEFREYLLHNAGLNQSTARTYFLRVKSVVAAAVDANILRKSPFKREDSIKDIDAEIDFATIEELEKLAATPCSNLEVKRAYFFGVATGLRKIDIRQLDRDKIRGTKIAKRIEKTDEYTYKPLSPMALSLLGELPAEGLLFELPDDARLSRVMKRWLKDAGISKHLTFHSSRHTFATQLLESGADLMTVSKLLDHTSTQHTQRYVHIVDRRKEEAVNALPRFDVQLGKHDGTTPTSLGV